MIDLRQKFFRLRFYLDHAFGHAPGSIKCHQKTTQAYKLIFGCKKKEKVLKKNQASFWLKIDNFKQKSCFEVRSHQDFIFKKISVTPLGLLIKLKCCRYACSIKFFFIFYLPKILHCFFFFFLFFFFFFFFSLFVEAHFKKVGLFILCLSSQKTISLYIKRVVLYFTERLVALLVSVRLFAKNFLNCCLARWKMSSF